MADSVTLVSEAAVKSSDGRTRDLQSQAISIGSVDTSKKGKATIAASSTLTLVPNGEFAYIKSFDMVARDATSGALKQVTVTFSDTTTTQTVYCVSFSFGSNSASVATEKYQQISITAGSGSDTEVEYLVSGDVS